MVGQLTVDPSFFNLEFWLEVLAANDVRAKGLMSG
jgi:hypothetical protein